MELNSPLKTYNSKKNVSPPLYLHILFIVGVVLSALGDFKGFGTKGMYLKVSMLFSICASLLYLLKMQDLKKLKACGFFLFFFSLPILFVIGYSMGIWSFKTIEMTYITRGVEKTIFQFVTIFSVVAGAYLFGSLVVDYFFIGICMGNALIMGLSFLKMGPGAALSNMPVFLRSIEIHDITFCMGLFCIYYFFNKPKYGSRYVYIAIAVFFFYMGLKRIALVSMGAAVMIGFVIKLFNNKNQQKLCIFISILLVVLAFLYVIVVSNGTFIAVMNDLGVDTQGRDRIYKYIKQYYEIGPQFTGYGFEYTVALLRNMRDTGEQVIKVTGIHNDFLKYYIELGFFGFFIWNIFTFVIQPLVFKKKFNKEAVLLCVLTNIYAWCTYLTDNTSYYFFMSMTLRAISIGMCFQFLEKREREKVNEDKTHFATHLTKEQIQKLDAPYNT